jgi:hypothetical protein
VGEAPRRALTRLTIYRFSYVPIEEEDESDFNASAERVDARREKS